MVKKRKLTVFYDQNVHTFRWLKALCWARKEFRKQNVTIDFADHKNLKFLSTKKPKDVFKFYEKKFTTSQRDIVFLALHKKKGCFASLEKQQQIELLKKLKLNCNTLVWLDISDSTGSTSFYVLPYVDFYLKKQLLKDMDAYKKHIYMNRIFTQYYHDKYGIDDPLGYDREHVLLDDKYKDKIRLSWNIGLGNIFKKTHRKSWILNNKYYKYLLHIFYTRPKYKDIESNRKYDLHFKGTKKSNLVYYQRSTTIELLKKRVDLNFPKLGKKVPYAKYLNQIKKSKCVISPFGWGEICTRDFEAFALGATLIKHDMDHLVTYPNWYIKDKTYISVDWDFSNFKDVLDEINSDYEKYKFIAQNAQELLKKYRTDKYGKKDFVKHLLRNIDIIN